MSNTCKAISLSAINASGISYKSLYSALTTNMFFGELSPLEIRVDKGIAKPYLTVPLPELDSLNVTTKKALLLTACLQQTAIKLTQLSSMLPINSIDKIIVTTSIITDENDDIKNIKNEWQNVAQEIVTSELPVLANKLEFNYVQQPSLEKNVLNSIQNTLFTQPILMIDIDSLCDYNDIKNLNNSLDIQCHQGDLGIMPAEAATSTLLIPNNYPNITHKQLIEIKPLNTSGLDDLKKQLTQANFTLSSHALHVGTVSEAWTTYWYGQTNSFYHQDKTETLSALQTIEKSTLNSELTQTPEPSLNLYNQTNVLGYLGAANLTTALASASALLINPLENMAMVWVIEHTVNSKNTASPLVNVYQITRAIHSNNT